MVGKADLPHIMAVINALTVAALGCGYYFVKRGHKEAHRTCMYVAVGLGGAFLVLYLTYHFGAGLAKFGGQGLIRPIYFTILIVHIIAAAAAAVVVPLAVYRALSGRLEAHRAIAERTWWLWMFVAVSGIVVYVMTIHLWPFTGAPA